MTDFGGARGSSGPKRLPRSVSEPADDVPPVGGAPASLRDEVALIRRALNLMAVEAEYRQWARRLELDPATAHHATTLFMAASGLRKARLALLERCGL